VWDIRLAGEQQIRIPVPKGYTTVLAVLKGSVRRGGPDIDGNDPGSGNGGGGDRDVMGFPQFHGHLVKHIVDFQIVPG
jgi:hypothetical protein